MTVMLSPESEALVRDKIESGRYADAGEVVQDALRLLDERDKRLQELRAELQIGLDQEERGGLVGWTPNFMARLTQEADERSRLGLPARDAVKPQTSGGTTLTRTGCRGE